MIRACIDFRDLNRDCPKEKFPTPYIDKIIDNCSRSVIFSFMDGFYGYNQIEILPSDQHKMTFICLWGTFAYQKFPFGLNNDGSTFQRALSYDFHDIKHIMKPYLDDLPSLLQHQENHVYHLRAIFLRCCHYNIQLNLHKCFFLC